LLLGAFFDKEVVGSFSLAQRLVALPMALLGSAVGQVFMAEGAELVRERPAELPAFFRRVSRKMLLPALGLLCLGAVCPFAFPIVFGPPWKTAGLYAAMLSVSCAAQLIVSPTSNISILTQRQGLQFALDALRMVAVVLAIWLPSRYGAGAAVAMGCYATVVTALYGVYYQAFLRIARGCALRVPAAQRPVS
jgi:O-antigen/teichoic acid export membrane protein